MSGWAAAGAVAGQLANTALSIYQSNKAWKRQKEVMKNQHQWEVQDLKNAGINPILTTMSHMSAPTVNTASGDLDLANALSAENAQRQQDNQDALTQAQLAEIQSRVLLNNASTAKEYELANLNKQQASLVPTQSQLNQANAANAAASAKQTDMSNKFYDNNPQIYQVKKAHDAMPTVSPGGVAGAFNSALNDVYGGVKSFWHYLRNGPARSGSVVKNAGMATNINSAPNNGTSSPTLTNSKMFTDYNDQ